MTVAHSSEIETKKTFILKEKRLDLLGRKNKIGNLVKNIFFINKQAGGKYIHSCYICPLVRRYTGAKPPKTPKIVTYERK